MADVQDAPSASAEEIAPVPEPTFEAVEAATLARLGRRTQVSPPTADPAPAPPVEQAAPTDATAKPASEPGKKKNADTRIQELLSERERERSDRDRERSETTRLRAELEQLRRQAPPDAKPAESSPAKSTTKEHERFKAMPDAPKLSDYDDYGDWSIDMMVFANRKGLEEYDQRQQQKTQFSQRRDQESTLDVRGVEAHPDFREVLMAAGNAGRSFGYAADAVLTHEQGHEIAYALAQAKDDHALYARLADPFQAGMVVAEILAKQSAPTRPVLRVSHAPEPPVTLGSQPSDKGDALKSAAASDDFTSFETEFLARKRGSGR